jgi:hypothetical protein
MVKQGKIDEVAAAALTKISTTNGVPFADPKVFCARPEPASPQPEIIRREKQLVYSSGYRERLFRRKMELTAVKRPAMLLESSDVFPRT